MILNIIIRPSRQQFRNLGPFTLHPITHTLQYNAIFFFCPWTSADGWIDHVDPSLTALFAIVGGDGGGDAGPFFGTLEGYLGEEGGVLGWGP